MQTLLQSINPAQPFFKSPDWLLLEGLVSFFSELNICSKANKKAAESKKKVPTLTYTATRLQEKGVLLAIDDLPATQ